MHIHLFLEYISSEKGYSEKTIKAYETDLHQFEDFILADVGRFDIYNIDSSDIRRWMMNLYEKSVAARSVNRKLSTLRSFYKYLQREGVVEKNPTRKILAPKTGKRLPSFVREEEMENLLSNVPFDNDFKGLRDKLVIELLYGTGMRLSELLSLKVEDVNAYTSSIKVLGKRNKHRIIPVTTQLNKIISEYLRFRKECFPDSDNSLILSNKGNPGYEALIYRICKKHIELVSSVHKKSPHVLRHTFATVLLNNGADLNVIKELLGHSNIATTSVYTHTSFKELTQAYKKSHPRA